MSSAINSTLKGLDPHTHPSSWRRHHYVHAHRRLDRAVQEGHIQVVWCQHEQQWVSMKHCPPHCRCVPGRSKNTLASVRTPVKRTPFTAY